VVAQVGRAQGERLLRRPADGQLGDHRGGRDLVAGVEHLEAGRRDPPLLELEVEAQGVARHDRADVAADAGVEQLAEVARLAL